MPRLAGRQSNTGSYVTFAFLLGLVIGAGVISEYLGLINLIPTFGQEGRDIRQESNTTSKLIAVRDIGEPIG
jgi:hypothetical protein